MTRAPITAFIFDIDVILVCGDYLNVAVDELARTQQPRAAA